MKFIEKSKELQSALNCPDLNIKSSELIKSSNYSLAPCDLMDIKGLDKQLKSLGVDFR